MERIVEDVPCRHTCPVPPVRLELDLSWGLAEGVTLVRGSSFRSGPVAWLVAPDAVSEACGITVVKDTRLGTVR